MKEKYFIYLLRKVESKVFFVHRISKIYGVNVTLKLKKGINFYGPVCQKILSISKNEIKTVTKIPGTIQVVEVKGKIII